MVTTSCFSQDIRRDSVYAGINWNEDMSERFFERGSDEIKAVFAVIKKQLGKKENIYPRFKIGNVVFVDILAFPPGFISDANPPQETIAVVPGANPNVITTPDNELFGLYIRNIRKDPEQIYLSRRIEIAVLLSVGFEGRDCRMDGRDESRSFLQWDDDGNTLVIHYKRLQNAGGKNPRREACTLTIDVNQNFSQECINEGNLFK